VLGATTAMGAITLVQGWDWYAGADPAGIGSQQYDFQTVMTHELGHALGLGHSSDAASVMYGSLNPGEVRRELLADDLAIPTYGGGTQLLQGTAAGQGSGCGCPYCAGVVRAAGLAPAHTGPLVDDRALPLFRQEDHEQAVRAARNGWPIVGASWSSGDMLVLAGSADAHGVPAAAGDSGGVLLGGLGEDLLVGAMGRDYLLGGFGGDQWGEADDQDDLTDETEQGWSAEEDSLVDAEGLWSDSSEEGEAAGDSAMARYFEAFASDADFLDEM
jgi:hypothetical protein